MSRINSNEPVYPYRLADGSVIRSTEDALDYQRRRSSNVTLLDTIYENEDDEHQQSMPAENTTGAFPVQFDRRASSAAQNQNAVLIPMPPSPPQSVTDDAQSYKSFHAEKPSQNFVQRHKRCLIILAVILFVLLLGGILAIVFFRQLAQGFINGASVHFDSIAIQSPTEDGFKAAIKGAIRNAGPFNAATSPMNLTIYHDDYALGHMTLPQVAFSMGSAQIETLADFTIVNKTALVKFNKQLLRDPSFQWRLVGNTNIRIMDTLSLDNMLFDKVIKLDGMGNFPGLKVQNFTLAGNETAITTQISMSMENTSPVAFEMGNLTFDMFYQGGYVGRVNTTLDSLNYGLNPIFLTGALAVPTNTSDPEQSNHFSQMFSKYLSSNDALVQCVGVSVVGKNGPVSWLSESIKTMNTSVVLPGGKDLKLIKSLSIAGMDMNFNKGAAPVLFASNVTASFQVPFEFSTQILSARSNVGVYNGDVQIASISSDWANASNAADPKVIITSIPPTSLTLTDDQQESFSDFLSDLFVSEKQTVSFKGSADLVIRTALGVLTVVGAPVDQSIESVGMQGLNAIKSDGRSSNPIVHNTTVFKGLSDQIQMGNSFTLYSASDVAVHLGDINLNLLSGSQQIGWCVLRNLSVYPGDNLINSETFYQPLTMEAAATGMQLIENFLNGRPSQTFMVGSPDNSTQIKLIAKSIAKIKLSAPMPGLDARLVKSSLMVVNPVKAPITKNAVASFNTVNPFGDSFTLKSISGTIYVGNSTMATMNVKLDSQTQDTMSFVVPANSVVDTPRYPVEMTDPLSFKSIGALGSGITRSLTVSAVTHIEASVGDFALSFGYNDSALPTAIKLTLK